MTAMVLFWKFDLTGTYWITSLAYYVRNGMQMETEW